MNIKLQHLVATQFEAAGFETFAKNIRSASGTSAIRKVAIRVIKQCMKADPSGFGTDVCKLSVKEESNNG
jgi:hypothetical protein